MCKAVCASAYMSVGMDLCRKMKEKTKTTQAVKQLLTSIKEMVPLRKKAPSPENKESSQ